MTAIAVVGVLLSVWGIARRIRLLRHGTRVLGQVTEADANARTMSYRYVDHTGEKHEGKSRQPRTTVERGDSAVVVYDPRRPRRHEVDMLGLHAEA